MEDIRQVLSDENLFDIRVVPGMSIPSDLEAQFSLHTKNHVDSVIAEFPDKTELSYIGEKQPNHHVYKVEFNRLGIELERDGFKEDDEIFVDKYLRTIKFRLENRSAGNHTSRLTLFTLPGATVKIFMDGRELFPEHVHERFLVTEIPVSRLTHNIKITYDLPD